MNRGSSTAGTVLTAVLLALLIALPARAAVGEVQSVELTLVGKTDLPSPGHDGRTRARGQNGDVAIAGPTAFVGGGATFHGAQSSPGRICTDYGGVKVVDIANPADPKVVATIDVEDTKGVLTAPLGNPRRGKKLANVSSSVSTLDVIKHPVTGRTILAVATQRCEQSFFDGARIEFWDVTDPAAPTRAGVFDPENVINPKCDAGPPITCPQGVTPRDGRWGIFEEVRMFARNNGPGGSTRVYALATTPFSIGNAHDASFAGDLRLLDITDPAAARQIATFPNRAVGQNSNSGCRTFQGGRSAAPTPDGTGAILSWYDGAQPADSVIPNHATTLGDPNSAALLHLSLDGFPGATSGSDPIAFTPAPPTWGYPAAPGGGETAAGAIEGNAADVQPFLGPNSELLTWVSEEDVDPSITRAIVDGPPESDYSGRACETMFAEKLYLRPSQELTDDIAFVGRGCPASPLAASGNRGADRYLEDPAGRIAVIDSGGSGFDGCSGGAKIKRAAAAGATGVIFSLGADVLNYVIPGPDGGLPPVPTVGMQLTGFDRIALVPNRVLSSTTFPAANWTRTSTSNVTVKPLAAAVATPSGTVADPVTNASPIRVTTAVNHGLSTGDRVAVARILGNTAANGNWTVTVTSPTQFTLNGSTGNGAYAGGGLVRACPAATPDCIVPADARTDLARIRSVADATDRVAGGRLNPTQAITTAAAAEDATSIPVAPLPAPLASGALLRFDNGASATLSAAAGAGATTLAVTALRRAIPPGARGSSAFRVTPGATYRAASLVEVEARTDGAFEVAVVWFDAAGTEIGSDAITPAGGLTAVSERTRHARTVTAPAGAARGSVRFGWTGAAAQGTAFVDSMTVRPDATVTLRDEQGAWGSQRIIDFSQSPPKEIASFRSPNAQKWPPPNDGVYAPEQARMLGRGLAFTAWMSDGLRVLDVSAPAAPRLVGSYVPPDVADPSSTAGAGPTDREGGTGQLQRGQSWPDRALVTAVDVVPTGTDEALVALSDINAGLYLVRAKIRREAAPGGPPPSPRPAAPGSPGSPVPNPPSGGGTATCKKFTVRRRDAARSRLRISTRVRRLCAGRFTARATAPARTGRPGRPLRRRTVRVATRIRRLGRSTRDFSVSLNLARNRAVMRRLRRHRRVTVTIRLRFVPSGKSPYILPQTRTVRIKVRASRRR